MSQEEFLRKKNKLITIQANLTDGLINQFDVKITQCFIAMPTAFVVLKEFIETIFFLSFFSQRFPLLENKEELHPKQYILQVQNRCHDRASYVELTFKSSRPNRNIQHINVFIVESKWHPFVAPLAARQTMPLTSIYWSHREQFVYSSTSVLLSLRQ